MVVIFVAALVAACHSTVVDLEDRPCRELEEIDSLMWKQPDSAFARLREFAASSKADSLDVFNGHYCQLLISELLYKNYYEQSNREELLKAVDYFDSLMMDNRQGAGKLRAEEQERNVFLDARVHYINGVGFYERGNEVLACEDYLKALGLMEDFFDENDLMGNRAVFMFYTYNRLLSLFSSQFMMDPAIACGENALGYCRKEPSLTKEIPNTYFYIGKQYDKKGERDVARNYYEQAIEGLSDINNLVYRDVVATNALCAYQAGMGADSSLASIRQMLVYAKSEKERLTRFLSLGVIFTIEQSFDSAMYYLIPVFEFQDNVPMQAQAAEYLLVNYDNIGDKEHLAECMRFLANHKKTEGETKALVSRLEDQFKDYMDTIQKKETEAERIRTVGKTVKIVVPIAVMVVLAIVVLAKLKSKKLLKEQQEEADRRFGETEQEHENELRRLQAEAEQRLADAERKHRQKVEEMVKRHEEELILQKDQSEKEIAQTKERHEAELEAERNAYQKEREELERSLQQSKENVSALQEELGRKRTGAAEHYAAFLEEPVCTKINALVRDLHITTRKPYSHYHISLDNETIAQLSEAVTAHYGELKPTLQCHYPGIGHEDLLLCYLYLLGLSNKQIAVLRQRDYSTVRKQAKELMGKLRIDETVREYVLRVGGIEGAAVE
jgi:tetratricopeptide (TPR) repeat protein